MAAIVLCLPGAHFCLCFINFLWCVGNNDREQEHWFDYAPDRMQLRGTRHCDLSKPSNNSHLTQDWPCVVLRALWCQGHLLHFSPYGSQFATLGPACFTASSGYTQQRGAVAVGGASKGQEQLPGGHLSLSPSSPAGRSHLLSPLWPLLHTFSFCDGAEIYCGSNE